MAADGRGRAGSGRIQGLSCAPASPRGVSTSALECSPGILHNWETLQSRFATSELQLQEGRERKISSAEPFAWIFMNSEPP